MFATGGSDCLVRIWNLANPREEVTLEGHLSCIRSLTFSPDDKLLVSVGDDGQVRYWDADSGGLHKVVAENTHRIWSAALSPDGTTLATASSDKTVKLWHPQDIVRPASIGPHPGAVTACSRRTAKRW